MRPLLILRDFVDKTQVFHDQIEAKQKDLQPWMAKINTKQAEIDVASSERDALAKKAETLEATRKEAEDTLHGLRSDHEIKVPNNIHGLFCLLTRR